MQIYSSSIVDLMRVFGEFHALIMLLRSSDIDAKICVRGATSISRAALRDDLTEFLNKSRRARLAGKSKSRRSILLEFQRSSASGSNMKLCVWQSTFRLPISFLLMIFCATNFVFAFFSRPGD